jgi:hypothetical protein
MATSWWAAAALCAVGLVLCACGSEDGDASSTGGCVGAKCGNPCVDDEDCGDGLACCDGSCTSTASDPLHCGGCSRTCSSNNVPTQSCASGVCVGACADGFGDCNDDELSDGCETTLASDSTNCGACGNVCSTSHVSAGVCEAGQCGGDCEAGWADCNADMLTDGCEAELQDDVAHCGSCGNACSQNHVASTCDAGVCAGTCATGHADCNGQLGADGCEVDVKNTAEHCGGCGIVCSTQHIFAACDAGVCDGECEPGFADCNGDKLADGCETDISNSVTDCGGCGTECSANNVAPTCTAGVCVGSCTTGFADCNSDKLVDGCETNIDSSPLSCGACGQACSENNVTAVCSTGVCTGSCTPGFADCNSNKLDDGCEVDLTTSPTNCGTCGSVCTLPNATAVCIAGACAVGSCGSGNQDCDANPSNGCESVAATDPANCGACGVVCGGALICKASACAAAQCNGQLGLPSVPQVPTDTAPLGTVIADLNNDGLRDLAIAQGGSFNNDGGVGVVMGKGNGTFGPRVDYTVLGSSGSIALGDLDGDGDPDLVLNDVSANMLEVFTNQGNGTFSGPISLPALAPQRIVISDVNGDGKLDLVHSWSNGASVLLNLGGGAFTPHVDYTLAWTVRSVAVGDLDGDSKPEMAVLSNYGKDTVTVYKNQGDGTYSAPVDLDAGDLSTQGNGTPSIELADMNGDGKLDIVTVGSGVSVLLNQGSATFAPRVSYLVAGLSGAARSALVADVDLDGDMDVAAAIDAYLDKSDYEGRVSVLYNQGNGTLGNRLDYPVAVHPRSISAGDLTGDGYPELVLGDYTNNPQEPPVSGKKANVLLNLGNGTFSARHDVEVLDAPVSATLADLDGDGFDDMLIADWYWDSVSVRLGLGDGNFGPLAAYPTATKPIWLAVTDVNQDGALDVAAACDDVVSVLLNQGAGTLGAKTDLPTGATSARNMVSADFNSDGKPDFAIPEWVGAYVAVILSQSNGSYASPVNYATSDPASSVAAGDFNADGKPDLAIILAKSTSTTSAVRVRINNGNGTFGPAADYGTGVYASAMIAADLNGDGKSDLAVTNRDDATVSVLLRTSSAFSPKVDYPTNGWPRGLTAADMDSDGKLDLVIADYWAASVLQNIGAGKFGPRMDFSTGAGPLSIAAGNLDADLRPDLITANSLDTTVSVLMNRCLP